MPRPSRVRRVLKWSGAALCGLTLLGYPVTYGRFYYLIDGQGLTMLVAGQGRIGAFLTRNSPDFGQFHAGSQSLSAGTPPVDLAFHLNLVSTGTPYVRFDVPLWAVFVLLALPTAWLWRQDARSRIPPGHCRACGYNLTGNVSGVCPECETKVPPEVRAEISATPPA